MERRAHRRRSFLYGEGGGGGVGCFNIEKTIIRVLAYTKKIKLFFGVENADFYCIINLYSDGNEGTADENI